MSTLLQPFVESGVLAGAVTLVADRNCVLELETCGYSDLSAGKPMQADTLFWIASQTKSLTASALMMLADEGKVRVEDPIEAYLPEFKELRVGEKQEDESILLRKPKEPVTLRHLLSHTSGLPFRAFIEEPLRDVIPLAYSARCYAATPLSFEPGTHYQYSNAGINTIGRVIEVVSGLTYEAFLSSRLLEPLGMTDTTFRPTGRQLDRLAKAYMPGPDGKGLAEMTLTQYSKPFSDPRRQAVPGGGLFSTASDVARFCRMMLNRGELDGRRYLSENAIAEMTRKQTGDAVEKNYGLGWETAADSFSHGGACSTRMTVDTRLGLVLLFLVQHAFPGTGPACGDLFLQDVRNRFAALRGLTN